MTNNSIQVMEEKYREELKAKDRQIQELKANYRRREEIRESLIREGANYNMVINHKRRSWNSAYDSYHKLKLKLSEDGLPEDIRADLEEEMAVARERFHEVQAEMEKEEFEFDELVRSLKGELRALDIEMRQ